MMGTALALTDEQRQLIHDSRSPYSAEDRVCAVMAFVVSGGNSEEAARKAEIAIGQPLNAGTLRQWKSRAPWWDEALQIARAQLQVELDAKYTRLLHETEKEMLKRVKFGDTHLDKEGDEHLVPVKLRDLVVAHGVISDKRAMIRGEPTSRKETTGVDLILRLADALQKQGEKKIAEAIPGTFDREN